MIGICYGMPTGGQERAAGRTPLYDNLGTYHMAVTTRSPVAQQYFDQGLRLTYGFNHDEAIKSYREGIARGLDLRHVLVGHRLRAGPQHQRADGHRRGAAGLGSAAAGRQRSRRWRAARSRRTSGALQARYAPEPVGRPRRRSTPPGPGRSARCPGSYPKDDDAATLHAEALMDLRPWNYWNNAGKPRAPSTLETVAVLERVVKRRLDHPGACHFYIHAIEASNFAARAVPCAERLGSLVPGAGHLVHMPTHIYMRLGRWDEAVEHNAHAVHVDQEYIDARHPTGVYPIGYVPHNYHVMWEALNMLGRSEEALRGRAHDRRQGAGRGGADDPAVRVLLAGGAVHARAVLPLGRRARRSPRRRRTCATPRASGTTRAGWRHAAKGDARFGRGGAGQRGRASPQGSRPSSPPTSTRSATLLQIADRHLAGDIAARQQRTDGGGPRRSRAGIALEDELTYDEPSAWALPLRQQLGAVLLAAGRPKEAERAYREDLVRYPNNGWSLHGLARALAAEGRAAEARTVDGQFRKAWSRADAKPGMGTF